MKITKQDLSLIPEMDFIKFEPLSYQTKVTAWNGGLSRVVAVLTIDGEINKECIISKKVFQVIKRLIGKADDINISVTKTFNVSSPAGNYRGAIVDNIMDPNYSLDLESMKEYPFPSGVISRAVEYANPGHKNPTLTGVNIGENGVVATDSFKFYMYGAANDDVSNIICDIGFLKQAAKNEFKSIKSNGHQVVIVDNKGIQWSSNLIDGRYPPCQKILSNKGELLDLPLNDIIPIIETAVFTLDEIKETDGGANFKGIVNFACKNNKLVISTDKFENEVEVKDCKDFKFSIFAKHAALMCGVEIKGIYFKNSKLPIMIEGRENENLIFNLINRGD